MIQKVAAKPYTWQKCVKCAKKGRTTRTYEGTVCPECKGELDWLTDWDVRGERMIEVIKRKVVYGR